MVAKELRRQLWPAISPELRAPSIHIYIPFDSAQAPLYESGASWLTGYCSGSTTGGQSKLGSTQSFLVLSNTLAGYQSVFLRSWGYSILYIPTMRHDAHTWNFQEILRLRQSSTDLKSATGPKNRKSEKGVPFPKIFSKLRFLHIVCPYHVQCCAHLEFPGNIEAKALNGVWVHAVISCLCRYTLFRISTHR
jgi:hypothetical protein